MSTNISTKFGILFLKLIARFPFWLIYIFADIFYFSIFLVFGYRKHVVLQNLIKSFPERTNKELKSIRKKYYRHLADLTLETVKMHGMKKVDYLERYKVKNPGLLNDFFDKGQSVVILTMHHNNWEWGNGFPIYVKHQVLGVYKPLHNASFDVFLNKTRSRFGAELVQNSNVLRRVIKAVNNNETVFTWLAGDQAPPYYHKIWYRFLNQEALFYQGPAAISRRFNHPVVFQNTVKKARGKYEISFELLFENPKDFSDVEIMKTFIAKMEEVIKKNPEYYLWSHKRWKHKRPEDIELQA